MEMTNKNPSSFAGIAAVLVLGIGLIAVGNLGVGIATLGLGIFALAIAVSPTARLKALFAAIASIICAGTFFYHAASNEITGTAVYRNFAVKNAPGEAVTRSASPAKFRQATNLLWALGGLCFISTAVCYAFYHALDD
jgi:hypothetical protein